MDDTTQVSVAVLVVVLHAAAWSAVAWHPWPWPAITTGPFLAAGAYAALALALREDDAPALPLAVAAGAYAAVLVARCCAAPLVALVLWVALPVQWASDTWWAPGVASALVAVALLGLARAGLHHLARNTELVWVTLQASVLGPAWAVSLLWDDDAPHWASRTDTRRLLWLAAPFAVLRVALWWAWRRRQRVSSANGSAVPLSDPDDGEDERSGCWTNA